MALSLRMLSKMSCPFHRSQPNPISKNCIYPHKTISERERLFTSSAGNNQPAAISPELASKEKSSLYSFAGSLMASGLAVGFITSSEASDVRKIRIMAEHQMLKEYGLTYDEVCDEKRKNEINNMKKKEGKKKD